MFGFIYTLLGLGAYGKGLIKAGVHDADNSAKAAEEGRSWYIDYKGNTRLVGTNEQVLIGIIDYVSRDRGYEIIDPHSSRRGQIVNLTELEREQKWKEAHEMFLRGIPYYRYGKISTVIDGEESDSKADTEKQLDPKRDKKYLDRLCQGFRLRDIETGRMLVERHLYADGELCDYSPYLFRYAKEELKKHGGNLYFVYMDSETGMIVRETEYYLDHPETKEETLRRQAFFKRFNEQQKINMENGMRESDPKRYFRNKSDWIDPRRRVRHDW